MKHLLDEETLKKWGFVWACHSDFNGENIVTSYVKEDTSSTDAHEFRAIVFSMFFHLNFNVIWEMGYVGSDDPLFKGCISSKDDLECILRSCVVFA